MSNTYVMDGKEYVEVCRRAGVGEKVLVVEDFPYGNIGEVHTILSVNHFSGDYVTDKAVRMNFGRCVVLEPVEDEASPQVTDLLANLARRVEYLERKATSLEQQLRDTQGNTEKLAEELATVKHQTQPQSVEVVTFEKFLDSIADKVAERLVGGGAR
jgi:hypothetical protein